MIVGVRHRAAMLSRRRFLGTVSAGLLAAPVGAAAFGSRWT